jgi:hypothetical protein
VSNWDESMEPEERESKLGWRNGTRAEDGDWG